MPQVWLQLRLQSKPKTPTLKTPIGGFVYLASVIDNPPQWWRVDADSPAPDGPVPAIGHNNCNHRTYRLTCRQYDRLLARAGGFCEICGLADHENAHGRLWIDHDHAIGDWAVRGLVCRRCNILLGCSSYTPLMQAFLKRAFHRALTAEAGFKSFRAPEPDLMTVLVDHSLRPWRREAEGWWPLKRHQSVPMIPVPWDFLIYTSGPHNLRPAQLDAEVPPMAVANHPRILRVRSNTYPAIEGNAA
jgi:hypothetical protein